MSEPEGLTIRTIYDHPSDYPDTWVARRWVNDKPTGELMVSADLDALRRHFARLGLVRLDRNPADDPVIVETWL